MATTSTLPDSATPQHDEQPAYVVRGRKLAATGLLLFVPALLLLGFMDLAKQVSHDRCEYEGCTKPLMAALPWAWRVMWWSGATGLVVVLLPSRIAMLRFCLACLQLLLLVTPFVILAGV